MSRQLCPSSPPSNEGRASRPQHDSIPGPWGTKSRSLWQWPEAVTRGVAPMGREVTLTQRHPAVAPMGRETICAWVWLGAGEGPGLTWSA